LSDKKEKVEEVKELKAVPLMNVNIDFEDNWGDQ